MCFGEADDKSSDAGELRVESKSMFASEEPELRVLKAFHTDSPKKNGLRRLRCIRPCPQASRLPGCPEAPGPGAACGVLLQPLACETPRRAGSTPTAVDAHAFELECHSKPGSSPSRAPGPRAIDARRGAVLSLERVRRREASRRGASRLQKLIWSSCGSSAAHGARVLRLLAA